MAKAMAKAKRGTSRGAKSGAKSKAKSAAKPKGKSKTTAKSKSSSKRPSKRSSKRPTTTKKAQKKKSPVARVRGTQSSRGVASRGPAGRTRLPHVGERGSGKGTIGKSGEGLDGGVARREAGDPGAIGTRPTSSRRPEPRKAKAQLPGEKAIADTDRTVPLRPERPAPGEREPLPPAALDLRRQVVGTDDPGDADDATDFDDIDDSGDADAP
jgi:hypothetical protein